MSDPARVTREDGPVAVVPPGGAPRPWRFRLRGAVLGAAAVECALTLGLDAISGVGGVTWRLAAFAAGAAAPRVRVRPLPAPLPDSLLALAVGAVFLAALTPLAAWTAPTFIRADPPLGDVDAVVVLSGTMTDDGIVAGPAVARLLTGLADARRLGAPVVVSELVREVDGRRVSSRPDQAALHALVAGDVPLHVVTGVASTRDEALRVRDLARERRWRRVRLVTSPLHSARACASFEAAGLPVLCAPATPRDVAPGHLRGWRQAGARLAVMREVLYETAATMLYRTRGWMP